MLRGRTVKAVVLLAAVLFAFGTAFAQGSRNQKMLHVTVIVKGTNLGYWQDVFDGARAAAKKLGDVKLTLTGPAAQTDVAQEVSMLNTAVSSKPDAIVIAPTKKKPLDPGIQKATKEGIPVIVIDSHADTTDYASFLATNDVAAGKLAGKEFIKFLKKKTGKAAGQVAYLTSEPGSGSLPQRDKGFLDVMKKYPGIKVVAHQYGNSSAATALSKTSDFLTRYPKLVGVFADNEKMADGAARAFAQANAQKSKVLVTFDSDSSILKNIKNGVIDATIVQDPYMEGYAGVMYGVMAHDGAQLPKDVATHVQAVTKANIGTSALQGLLHPKQRQLEPYVG